MENAYEVFSTATTSTNLNKMSGITSDEQMHLNIKEILPF